MASSRLANGDEPETARLDAELLVTHVTGFSRARLFAFPESPLTAPQLQALDTLLEQRLRGKPLAYLTGLREFWSMPLEVNPGVLIPRPDTEVLVEQALALEPHAPSGCIIELGTGSGAIALALARELPHRQIVAVEKQAAALAVALSNVTRWGEGRVHLVQSDWLCAINANSAAMVIANPPYLAASDPHLPGLSYEPRSALVSGNSGLEDIQRIIADTRQVGKPGCILMLEHGYEQATAVQSLMANYTYEAINTKHDLAGQDRVTYATMNTRSDE